MRVNLSVFKKRSERARLMLADVRLQHLLVEVASVFPCTILETKRTEARQKKNVESGVSKTMDSKHVYPLGAPSLAVDVAPSPLVWPQPPKDGSAAERKRWMKEYGLFYYFGGFALAKAQELGYRVRWGGDWNGNFQINDQSFDDLPHFEIMD